ncbi:MAG: hypothetical protein HQM10_04445 [Candidatus Riflebacteria bacterium]|nr:hypothetical protein [Candidatus Riflebacteria bacterium]
MGNERYYRKTHLIHILIFLGMLFGLTSEKAEAIITNPTVTLTNDSNGDGIAGIGDTVTFACRSNNATAGVTPFINLGVLGNPYYVLPNLAGNYYSAIFSISNGSFDNSSYNPQFTDNDSMVNSGSTISIDNQPPISLLGIVIDTSAAKGKSGEYIAGDYLKFSVDFSDADGLNGPPRLNVYANLSNLGLGTNVPLTYSGGGKYTFNRVIQSGRERNADSFDLLAVDDAGNRKTYAGAVSYDTRIPNLVSVVATNTSGFQYIKTGNVVKITATVSDYDGETLTASNSILIPGSPVTMNRTGASTTGGTTTFEYTFAVPSGTNLETDFVNFEVVATDDAGNATSRFSNSLAVDTIPPVFALPLSISILEHSGVKNDNIAIIGDQLYILGNLSAIMSDVLVTVDLSAIGGVSNQICPISPGSTTFSLLYDVRQYTSEDYTPRSFTVKAQDKATNVIYEVTLPVIYVDNKPPSITTVILQKMYTTGTAKLGDTIALQANATDLDNGRIWADLRDIGGNGSDSLPLTGANTYRLEMTVGKSASNNYIVDGQKNYTVWMTDNAGNEVSMSSNGLYFDNEPPVILAATWTVTPSLSATHPYVKTGDKIKFSVSLASSGASIYDNQGVFMNLSALGKASTEALTYDGAGSYTIQVTVPAGTLNEDTVFSITAKDNAENTAYSSVAVQIDNSAPSPGPMTINYIRDVAKTGAMNIGDRLEFIVPVTDPDGGTCTVDLSILGGATTMYMNYDPTLLRYYLVVDTASTTLENSTYVFRATVSDKAGNTMTSLSSTYEVDCVPPVIDYASATFQNMVGNALVINVGDRLVINAKVDPLLLDGGTPQVNLSVFGGNSAQIMYDDGAHNDGAASDGLYGFSLFVASGSIDGQNITPVVELKDNCGNMVNARTETLFVDNQPLLVQSFIASISYDHNANTVVDLDGMFTTKAVVSTDVVKLSLQVNGNGWDFGTAYLDLTPLGIGITEHELNLITSAGGKSAVATFSPIPGTTNRENVSFKVTVVDVNGNITYATSTPRLLVDNLQPTIQVYPLSFTLDNGRLNEANEGDVLRVKVRLSNHDGILPQIDFTNLYLENGLTPPSPILFPPGGPNEYSYDWTVPAGLGSTASLTIITYDSSGNMVVGYTNNVRFLSKTPSIKNFPSSRADLSYDTSLSGFPNNIANPADKVTLTCVMNSAYNTANNPAATVLADIRTITEDSADDSSSLYYDGDLSTYWTPMIYQAPPISGGGNYVYMGTFTVGISKKEIGLASFPVKILHPDVLSITMATGTLICDSAKQFAIDTLIPNPVKYGIYIDGSLGDNLSISNANIGDIVTVFAEIKDFADPGSASVKLLSSASALIEERIMYYSDITSRYEASFEISTWTASSWLIPMQGTSANDYPRYSIRITDDAENLAAPPVQIATFAIDNVPPQIIKYQNVLSPNQAFSWVANVGSGISSDSIIASMSCDFQPYDAFIDLSPIQGSSSWPITFSGSMLSGKSSPFILSTPTIDLATFVLPIFVRDKSGNTLSTYTVLAVDTTRPSLTRSEYDGERLYLTFSESLTLKPGAATSWFDHKVLRIGNRDDLSGNPPDASYTIQLSSADTLEDPGVDSKRVSILLSQDNRRNIADWGSTTIWLSMGTSAYNAEGGQIGVDLSGNWVRPLIQNPATHTISVPVAYAVKPKLTGGWYDAVNTPSDLHLQFDKDMDLTTWSDYTISSIAIVKTRSNDSLPADYTKRYTVRTEYEKSATISSNKREVILKLSQEAQNWIAMKYQRTAASIYISVASNPVLIRDVQGNRVTATAFEAAVPAALTPVLTNFNINSGSTLDINSGILSISFERSVRLFNDEMQVNYPAPSGRTVPNSALSKVFLYKNADRTGSSLVLSRASVPASFGVMLLNDYIASSANILLSTDDIREILSWNTDKIYVTAEQGAFRDLWDNQSNRYPLSGSTAMPVAVTFPTSYNGPKVIAVAMSDPPPTKSYSSGNLFYEVEFETATITPNIYIPINRDILPSLTINKQDDESICDIGSFVAWSERDVSGKKRVVARFANTQPFPSAQSLAAYMKISNCFDVFGKALDPDPTVASYVYNTADRINSGTGFANASQPMTLDSEVPYVISVTPIGVIGRTAANTAQFLITFSEPMNQSESYRPSLRLGDINTTVMNFGFESWIDSTTARYFNAADFGENTAQGSQTYYVSSGYDLSGNRAGENVAYNGGKLEIRSRGPMINAYTITTYPSTTAKYTAPTGHVTGKPFSPYILPGVATITITYSSQPSGNNWLHFCQGNTTLGSIPVSLVGNTGTALWNGTLNGNPIGQTGPFNYEMRVYDENGNEGNQRSTLVYDGQAPTVLSWLFSHARSSNGKVFFSPRVHSYVKIDSLGIPTGEAISLRVRNAGLSTDTYQMGPLSGGGYTISFDGRSTDSGNAILPDGTYVLNVVDAAGNIGVPLGPTGVSTATMVIDSNDPQISQLTTFRTDNSSQTTRFNPRVSTLTIQALTGDPAVSSGTLIARIMSGSTVVKDLPMGGMNSPFSAIWDGTNSSGKLVEDGTYRVTVIDEAENPSSMYVDINVLASAFKVSSAVQIDSKKVRLIFTHDVNISDAENLNNYSISPNDPVGIGFLEPVTINGKMVDLSMNLVPTHNSTYTITVASGFRSSDDDQIVSGNNTARYSADTMGPMILNVTFSGITNSREFNLVFDETLDTTSATTIENYRFVTSTETLSIASISIMSDNRTVKIHADDDILESQSYTIYASGVEDLFRNKSNSSLARYTFKGQDVTPPVLTASIFSNPADEYDISIALLTNEELSEAPTAFITQSGGSSNSLIMNVGPTNRLFLGGSRLDKSFPGNATVKVTGKDLAGNTATVNLAFVIAYVNASARASVVSADQKFSFVFPNGSLNKDSMISVVSEKLNRDSQSKNLYYASSRVRASMLKSKVSPEINAVSGQELSAVTGAYLLSIPTGRLKGKIEVSADISGVQNKAGIGIFAVGENSDWKFISRDISSKNLVCTTDKAGVFAVLRDSLAPSVKYLGNIEANKTIKDVKPVFEWNIQDAGAGVDYSSVQVILDDKRCEATVNTESGKITFQPRIALKSGEHIIYLSVSDNTGNNIITESLKFNVRPQLSIHEIAVFPNPARSKAVIRVGMNRDDVFGESVEVDIYDSTGAKVKSGEELRSASRFDGERQNLDLTWDLTNEDGKRVANGLYFVKVVVHDPDNYDKKTKMTKKIAVLR